MTAGALKRVVILGGGFAGLYAARELKRAAVEITLIDRRNHHLFQPLLYQVASAALNPSDIAAPIRGILRAQRNVTVLLDEARAIDVAHKAVVVAGGELPYDFLIVATGATDSYFGHPEWAPVAPSLKSIEEALLIRGRVLLAFEAAEREQDAERRRAWLTFVVVGGGPTGAELAGALAEIARHTLTRDFRRFDPSEARVLLVEGQARILPTFSPKLSEKGKRQLERLGVDVRLGAKVTHIDEAGVTLAGAPPERVAARTVLWAAGVAGSPLGRSLGAPLDRAGRVKVERDLTVPAHPEVFVVGDLAALEQDGAPIPGLAPAAIQEGRHAARNIRRALDGKTHLPFRYRDKGSLATLGRSKAVGQFRTLELSGFIAWAAWLLVHIFFLIGFRNRALVLFEWAWAYVTYQRGARLITGPIASRSDGKSDAASVS